jgi:Ribonuclease G/E
LVLSRADLSFQAALFYHKAGSYHNRRADHKGRLAGIKAAKKSLGELWESPEHQTYRRKMRGYEFAPCTLYGGGELIYENKEDCCGNCLWPQGVIQCP